MGAVMEKKSVHTTPNLFKISIEALQLKLMRVVVLETHQTGMKYFSEKEVI